MKVANVIKKILIGVLVVVFFTFAIAMTVVLLNVNTYGVSQFNDITIVPIREKTTSNNYNKGDLVLVEKRTIEELEVGKEVFVYKVNSDGSVDIEFGPVGEVYKDDKVVSFENGASYKIDFVIGEKTKVYEGWGTYYSIVQSKWGFLFIILVPSFLIFVYEIFALIIEIKYGKEETK